MPEQGNVQPWREAEVLIRESLLDGTVGGDLSEVRYNRAIMALTALTAQIEELEHDAIDVEADRRYQQDRARAAEQRVEELERERDEARKLLAAESPCEQRLDEEVGAHIKTEDRAKRAELALAKAKQSRTGVYEDKLTPSERVEVAQMRLAAIRKSPGGRSGWVRVLPDEASDES